MNIAAAQRPEKGMRSPLVLSLHYYVLYVYLGLGMGIAGPTLGALARQSGAAPGDMGLYVFSGSLGFLFGTLLSGRLFDRFKAHPLLGCALLLSASIYFSIPFNNSFILLVLLNFIRGLSDAMIGTSPNTLLTWLHREKSSPWINALHFCFGLGACLSPFMVGLLAARPDGYRITYVVLAVFAFIAGIRMFFLGSSPMRNLRNKAMKQPEKGKGCSGPAVSEARNRVSKLLIFSASFFLFFYVSTEISFATWFPTYAVTLGLLDEGGAALTSSLFWFSFTAGRFISIFLALKVRPSLVIPVGIAGSIIAVSLQLLPAAPLSLVYVSVALLGLCLSPLWAGGFNYAGSRIALTAVLSSYILLGDSLGATILPSITGKLIEWCGARAMIYLVVVSLTVCFWAFLLMRFSIHRSKRIIMSEEIKA